MINYYILNSDNMDEADLIKLFFVEQNSGGISYSYDIAAIEHFVQKSMK